MTSDRIRSAIKRICYARKRPRRFVFLDYLSRLSIGIREEIGYCMLRCSGEYHQRSAVPCRYHKNISDIERHLDLVDLSWSESRIIIYNLLMGSENVLRAPADLSA